MYIDRRGYGYRKKREGKRVTSIYMGHGEGMEFLAAIDEFQRAEAAVVRQAKKMELDTADQLDRVIKDAGEIATSVMRATLKNAGYHQHARGPWRKKRSVSKERRMADSILHQVVIKPNVDSTDRQKELILRAQEDPQAAVELLDSIPDPVKRQQFIDYIADVGTFAQHEIAKTINSGAIFEQSMDRKLQMMRDELNGPSPSALERMLTERILTCWLHVNQLELKIERVEFIDQAEAMDKRLSRAHKRYLSAIQALAQVRKLNLPNIQVNIGEKQINVAS